MCELSETGVGISGLEVVKISAERDAFPVLRVKWKM
jgi:hypothetical protein